MDALTSYLTSEIIKALGEGAFVKAAAFVAIFALVWVEVRGVKNEVKNVNKTMAGSFAAGEARFTNIEKDQQEMRLDINTIKAKIGG